MMARALSMLVARTQPSSSANQPSVNQRISENQGKVFIS
jgi:hypothetical protein